jgi:hypothetical protein
MIMTQTTKPVANGKADVAIAIAVILYGMSGSSKPQAGLFPASLSDRAIKAAAQLKLNVLKVTTADIADIAKRLPIGRINSSGKGFVPTVRQSLYDDVVKASGASATPGKPAATAPTPKGNGAAANLAKVPLNEARNATHPAMGPDGLPRTWSEIAPNHLVLAQESAMAGWAEVLVVARNDDLLTVRWKNYPGYKPFTVHVDAVALLNASPSFKT